MNKDRLVTITNCMMHFPKLPNRSLFIDISRGGGYFMCVCVGYQICSSNPIFTEMRV